MLDYGLGCHLSHTWRCDSRFAVHCQHAAPRLGFTMHILVAEQRAHETGAHLRKRAL
jgi:hypothetical protein